MASVTPAPSLGLRTPLTRSPGAGVHLSVPVLLQLFGIWDITAAGRSSRRAALWPLDEDPRSLGGGQPEQEARAGHFAILLCVFRNQREKESKLVFPLSSPLLPLLILTFESDLLRSRFTFLDLSKKTENVCVYEDIIPNHTCAI